MAARVAAQLRKDPDLQVQTIKGGLGEFSVLIEGIKLIDTNRLWYPRLAEWSAGCSTRLLIDNAVCPRSWVQEKQSLAGFWVENRL
jgi:hypothetical protein